MSECEYKQRIERLESHVNEISEILEMIAQDIFANTFVITSDGERICDQDCANCDAVIEELDNMCREQETPHKKRVRVTRKRAK